VRFRDGYEPHGDAPFEVTPETYLGSFFEAATSTSRRVQENGTLYLPPITWMGMHDLRMGVDLDQINFSEEVSRTPIRYLREDGTLLRLSTFPQVAPFSRNNFDVGSYIQDRWVPRSGLLVEIGLRFDWDEIVRRELFSPRIALTYAPDAGANTKLAAGIGLYYEHTQLEYLEESLAGMRYDTYYAPDGVTPISPPLLSTFVADNATLHEPRALNWSVGIEQKLPGAIYASVSYLGKHSTDVFVYSNPAPPPALTGTYSLVNSREQDYRSVNVTARHTFEGGYVLFGAYTWSDAHTNAALEYIPTLSVLGPQAGGPLPWDAPNRVLSWAWLPVPKLKRWDFVYTVDWRTGFPFTSINANQQLIGEPGSRRFPDYFSFSPGLEWKFHFRGAYFGLRGVIENITDRQNPAIVNNVVVSPEYGTFSVPQGRALTARIRLIGSK
jgi:outer membrane receptor for ferrienterochelin and colicin